MSDTDGAESTSLPPSVFDRIADAIAQSEEDAEDVLDQRPDLAPVLEIFKRWAAAAVESAHFLRPDRSLGVLSWGDGRHLRIAGDAYRLMAESMLVRPFLDSLVAHKGLERSETANARLFQVLECLVESELKPPAEHYLHRVGQLYLWGFDLETYALARSALDSALQSRLADERVREFVEVRGRHVSLYDRIKAARHAGLLGRDGESLAHDIREAGNDILHRAPSTSSRISSPLDGIKALRQVLAELYPVP